MEMNTKLLLAHVRSATWALVGGGDDDDMIPVNRDDSSVVCERGG